MFHQPNEKARFAPEPLQHGDIDPALTIEEQLRKDFPQFNAGDTVKVHVRIKEGEKERLQAFEGVLIARNGMGMGESITVRKISFGQGVERIFPVNARVIDHTTSISARITRHSTGLSSRRA